MTRPSRHPRWSAALLFLVGGSLPAAGCLTTTEATAPAACCSVNSPSKGNPNIFRIFQTGECVTE